jgi:hypothetical protein
MTGMSKGIGERAEAARRRRMAMMVMASAVTGILLIGGTTLFTTGPGHIAPGWAVAFTLISTTALAGSFWLMCRTDEVAARRHVFAAAAAGGGYALIYPGWFAVWQGGLLPEPDHELLFAIVATVYILASLWKKLR